MKKCPSEFRMALAAITATAIYLGAWCSVARAQNTSTTNAAATPQLVAQANPANPSGVFPPGSVPPGASVYTPAPGSGQAPALAFGVGEVLKMYQGGINKDIIVNYINSTSLPYHLTADQIIYMQTLGMPQEITKAMILRDGQLQQQHPQPYYQPQPMQQPMPPPPYGAVGDPSAMQVAAPSTPPPAVTVVGTDPYPVYDYGYPYYGPVVAGGWGWGWGWGPGGWGWGWGWGRGGGGFRGGGFRGGGFGGGHGGFGGGHGGGGGHR